MNIEIPQVRKKRFLYLNNAAFSSTKEKVYTYV